MLKVFIAEDESVVREGLRDSIPWESCGFEFAGDAMDGETALPMILECCPDLLITDIRMPFMDGLELIQRVREVLPDIKILILSGYDDFSYAKRAIELRVNNYLLKPILKADMVKALNEIRIVIEAENEKTNYITKYMEERQMYDQYSRVHFFTQLVAGNLSEKEIAKQSGELDIDLDAEQYQTVLFMLQTGTDYSESEAMIQEKVLQNLMPREDVLLFRSEIQTYCAIIKGLVENIEKRTEECISIVENCCESINSELNWYAAAGKPVDSAVELRKSYNKAMRLLSYRHFVPQVHCITQEIIDGSVRENKGIDFMNTDPIVIRSFIKSGLASEVDRFVRDYLESAGEGIHSVLFRNFLIVSVRLNAAMVIQEMGLNREEYISQLPPASAEMEAEKIPDYIKCLLNTAISLRDAAAQNKSGDIVNLSLAYIDEHYTEESISLNTVAKAINISANYLSAAFSQKMGVPFVEYITEKRMAKAKELLRQTNKRSGEIGADVGYHDPRYFSFVFKKTQGCSPKEYRSGEGIT